MKTNSPSSTAFLMVALALVLLTFFIALMGISVSHRDRQSAAINSVHRSFRVESVPDGRRTAGGIGTLVSAQRAFHASLKALFLREIPAARIVPAAASGDSVVILTAESLFSPGTSHLRPARGAFFGTLISILNAPPPGVAFSVEIVLGTNYDSRQKEMASDELARLRAVSLASAMVSHGAEPEVFVVGIGPVRGASTGLSRPSSKGTSDVGADRPPTGKGMELIAMTFQVHDASNGEVSTEAEDVMVETAVEQRHGPQRDRGTRKTTEPQAVVPAKPKPSSASVGGGRAQ